jgi:tubulin polyglutamylase TTLL6/13
VDDTDDDGRDDESKRGDASPPFRAHSSGDWDLYWQDAGNIADKVVSMQSWQRINHWPGNSGFCRKDGLARTLKRMSRVFPKDFDFAPRTWTLPDDWADFQAQFSAPVSIMSGGPRISKTTFIVKPAASSQGRGIYLTRRLEDVDPRTPSIAQRYIAKPFLIDGLKFDMRIYVLVTSVDPLRVWLFDEGLCRFATNKYVAPAGKNFSDVTMHLTNYAINKDSPNFIFNKGGVDAGSTGSKRTLTWFKKWLDANGYSSSQVFGRIAHMINKALLAAQPHFIKCYRASAHTDAGSMQAFELFGLDVLLDSRLRPWLLESNMSPSLTCDTKLVSNCVAASVRLRR